MYALHRARALTALLVAGAAAYQSPAASRAPAGAGRAGLAPRLALLGEPAAPSGARERESRLVQWLEDNGVRMSEKAGWGQAAHPLKVESETVEDFELSGRGLLARKDVVQGEEIVKIPTKLIMTKETAQQVLGPRVVPEAMGEYLALALLLMHEASLGDASFWAAYVSILPTAEEVGQTWTWPDEELRLLEGSGIVESTASLKAKLRREYDALVSDTIVPNGLSTDVFSYEAFEWAFSMLFSRAIDLRETETLALVPYADLLNHSPFASSYFFLNNVPLSREKEVCLYADRAYARNDQVLISYGQKSNSELLLLYGFVVDRNIFDEVELAVSLEPDDPRYDEKAQFLASQGLKTSMAFPLLIDRYSSELTQFLRLCCISPSDGPLGSYRYSEPISLSNEKLLMNTLRDGCLRALARYPESEEEDRKLMENSAMFLALSRNMRMAVKLRRNEKRILLRTIRTCETALANMPGGGGQQQAPADAEGVGYLGEW